MAQGVEKLCQELAPAQQDVGNSEDAGPVGPMGFRSELAALAANVKAEEERDNALQALATETLQIIKNKEPEGKIFGMSSCSGPSTLLKASMIHRYECYPPDDRATETGATAHAEGVG